MTTSRIESNKLDIINDILNGDADCALSKLKLLLEQDKSYLDINGIAERSLLQMVIYKNLCDVALYLIKLKPELIAKKDRNGQNAIHTVIANKKDNKILEALLASNINACYEQDKSGKLPLHFAVITDNLFAVERLPKNRGCLYREDAEKQSPCCLARGKDQILGVFKQYSSAASSVTASKVLPPTFKRVHSPELRNVLNKDFSKLALFEISANMPDQGEAASISTTLNDLNLFSLSNKLSVGSALTTPHSSSPSPRSVNSHSSSPSPSPKKISIAKTNSHQPTGSKLTVEHKAKNISNTDLQQVFSIEEEKTTLSFESIEKGKTEVVFDYLKNGGSPDAIGSLGRPLVLWAFIYASNNFKKEKKRDNPHLQVFLQFLQVANIEVTDKNKRNLLEHAEEQKVKIDLLKLTVKKLAPQVRRIYQLHHETIDSLNTEFEANLLNAGLDHPVIPEESKFPTLKNFSIDSSVNQEGWNEIIWEICALKKLNDKDQVPDSGFPKIYISALVQALLSKLSPERILSILNELFAYFSPQQRLVANFIVKELVIWSTDLTILQNVEYTNFNLQNKILFPLHAPKMQILLESIIDEKNRLRQNTLLKNFTYITEFLCLPAIRKHESFAELIECAIDDQSVENIAAVANEIRAVMFQTLQNISISEFYDKNWSNDEADRLAPNLKLAAHIFNQITAYIRSYIVLNHTQTETTTKFIELLIAVANYLCKYTHAIGIDLNSANAILCALDTPIINRHKLLDALSEESKAILADLNKLFSPAKKYQHVTTLSQANAHAMPLVSLMQSDITFVYDGNATFNNRACVLGISLRNFLIEQNMLAGIHCKPTTNIVDEVVRSNHLTDNDLFIISYHELPPTICLTQHHSIDNLKTELTPLLDKKIIPVISFNGVIYNPNEMIDAIISILYAHRQLLPKNERKQFMPQAKTLVESLIMRFDEIKDKKGSPNPPLRKAVNPLYGKIELQIMTGSVHKRSTPRFKIHPTPLLFKSKNPSEDKKRPAAAVSAMAAPK